MKQGYVHNSRQGGFTLIELMVVVAIIAILASLAVPMLTRYKDHARIADARSVGQQLLNSLASEAANPLGGSLTDIDTCDELAATSIANGFFFSEKRMAQFCPSGTALAAPAPHLPGRLCTCFDGIARALVYYDCEGVQPLGCSVNPFRYEPWDIEIFLPILSVQDDLHVVASTLDGVSVVSAADLPVVGQVITLPGGPSGP